MANRLSRSCGARKNGPPLVEKINFLLYISFFPRNERGSFVLWGGGSGLQSLTLLLYYLCFQYRYHILQRKYHLPRMPIFPSFIFDREQREPKVLKEDFCCSRCLCVLWDEKCSQSKKCSNWNRKISLWNDKSVQTLIVQNKNKNAS